MLHARMSLLRFRLSMQEVSLTFISPQMGKAARHQRAAVNMVTRCSLGIADQKCGCHLSCACRVLADLLVCFSVQPSHSNFNALVYVLQ
jgi:hypothetical protein